MGRPTNKDVKFYDKKLRWFRITRYEPFRKNNLSPAQWLEQVSFRRFVLQQVELYPQFYNTREFLEGEGLGLFKAFLELIRKNPVIDSAIIARFCCAKLDEGVRARLLPIQPTTIQDIFLWQAFADPDLVAAATRFYGDLAKETRQGSRSSGEPSYSSRIWDEAITQHSDMVEDLFSHLRGKKSAAKLGRFDPRFRSYADTRTLLNKALLTVDLTASDTTIHERLSELLPVLRRNTRPIPANKFSLETWASSGLIPYTDLRIWHLIDWLPRGDFSVPPFPGHVAVRKIFEKYKGLTGVRPNMADVHFESVFLRDDGGFKDLQILVGQQIESSVIRIQNQKKSSGRCS